MNGDKFVAYVQSIVSDMIAKVGAADVMNPAQAEKLKEDIRLLLRRFDLGVEQILPPDIVNEYFGGMDEAAKDLIDNGVDVKTGMALGKNGVINPEFRVPVYLDSLQTIMDDSFLDLKAARRMTEENAVASIDKAIDGVKAAIAKGTIQGNNRKVIQGEVMREFRENGLTSFLTQPDKNGVQRRLPLDFYAMTVTRYKMREAGVQGSVIRYKENNQDLLKIIERSTTCEICGMFKDMVVSLSGETPGYPKVGDNGITLPPYHPNCRGTTRVFVVSRKTPEEIAEAKAKNNQYEPPKDNRTPAQKAAYEKEQEKRAEANEEKKQFMRWNETLGADNFKTLGAFRKAKRENSPKFQELQSNYRSARSKANNPPPLPPGIGGPRTGPKPRSPVSPNAAPTNVNDRFATVIERDPPPLPKPIKPKSWRDADDYESLKKATADEYGIKIKDMKDVPLEAIRGMVGKIDKTIQRVPELREYMTAITLDREAGNENAYVYLGSKNSTIYYSSKKFTNDNYDEYLKSKAREARGNMKVRGPGIDASTITTHEMGHILSNYFDTADFWKYVKTKKYEPDPYLKQKTLAKLKMKNADIRQNLSVYGTSNPSEFVAECFAELVDSEKPRPLALAFGEVIDEVLTAIRIGKEID